MMLTGPHKRAFTILEAIISLFLLSGALLIIINLFDTSLGYLKKIERQNLAILAGESTLADIKAWAADPANFYSNWAPYNGVVLTDPTVPGYQIQIDCTPSGLILYSPSSSLESVHGPLAKSMSGSVVPVRLEVRWDISGQQKSFVLNTYIQAPEVTVATTNPLRVTRTTGPTGTVGFDQDVGFAAVLEDSSGNPIPGVTFDWSVEPAGVFPDPPGPGPGNATLLNIDPRSGQSQTMRHQFHFDPLTGSWEHSPGTVRLRARAVYHGREYLGEFGPVLLGDS